MQIEHLNVKVIYQLTTRKVLTKTLLEYREIPAIYRETMYTNSDFTNLNNITQFRLYFRMHIFHVIDKIIHDVNFNHIFSTQSAYQFYSIPMKVHTRTMRTHSSPH